VTDIAILCVMFVGIVAMVIFMFKRGDITTEDHEWSSRHKRHRKYSFWGTVVFFLAVIFLGLNYIAVEFSCIDKWIHCDEKDVRVNNSFELIFHFVLMVFATCETIVCWIVKDLVLEPSRLVWLGLAVVQAANVAFWFNTVLKESHHRIEGNIPSIEAYFSFCNSSSGDGIFSNETIDDWCRSTESAPASRCFLMFILFLYPFAIEFCLLVSETFLYKVIGANSRIFDGNAAEATINHIQGNEPDNDAQAENRRCWSLCCVPSWLTNIFSNNAHNNPDEETPLLPGPNQNYTNSCCSKLFIVISFIVNTGYVLLSILVFIAYKSDSPQNGHQLQRYNDVFAVYSVIYVLFSIICCAIGIGSCLKLEREPSHTSFLEYLLLFSTSGLLFESFKVITCYAIIKEHSSLEPVYYMLQAFHIIEVIIQIVFYYYSKDVSENPNSPTRVDVLKNVMVVIAINNFASWISDSFLLIEMNYSTTPADFYIEEWPVFDNVVIPIVIFFRFNSALLFWCNV